MFVKTEDYRKTNVIRVAAVNGVTVLIWGDWPVCLPLWMHHVLLERQHVKDTDIISNNVMPLDVANGVTVLIWGHWAVCLQWVVFHVLMVLVR